MASKSCVLFDPGDRANESRGRTFFGPKSVAARDVKVSVHQSRVLHCGRQIPCLEPHCRPEVRQGICPIVA